jgi:Hydrazine synthase alpha subunit middle domain
MSLMKIFGMVAGGVLLLAQVCRAAEVKFGFETGDLQGWQIVEGSFGTLVSDRATQYHVQTAFGKEEKFFLSTLDTQEGPSDNFTGTIESPIVMLDAPTVTLRVCGGSGNDVYVALCTSDGKEILYARGKDNQVMEQVAWTVPTEALGKPLFFRVVDHATGGWGHIIVDGITCSGKVDAAKMAERVAKQKAALSATVSAPTKAAIEELGRLFKQYPATQLLGELETTQDLAAFQRKALVTLNPIVNSAPILFVTRKQYRSDHHNTETMFQTKEINTRSYDTEGAFKVLEVASGRVTTLFEPGKEATVRDPDIDFEAKNIVFSMRKGVTDDYHIYTLSLEKPEAKQLTSKAEVSDIDPIWLPDGDILFSSSREPKYCMCNRHIMCNLYRMKPDGANIHQIGKSTLFEGHSSLMPDGRILYDRWEYVDRNFGDAQGLWVCNPDGTGHAIYWGNNTTSPGGVIDARTLSKSHLSIAVMAACHDRPWGALGLIDRSKGIDGKEPVLRTWPAEYREQITTKGQNFDSPARLKIKYEDPFPLDDEHFLCSRMTGKGEETAIYYLDLHGNEVLVTAQGSGCFDPMPIRPRTKPAVQPTRRTFNAVNGTGYFYVQNAAIGTHMKGVNPGDIKYLRVVESPEKRSWSQGDWNGQGAQAAAMNWHNFENKRILGTVPVESDGSAYFEAPGNTYLFFQALDKDGILIQSMRSGIYVQPGETYGCVGCHENRVGDIPAVKKKPTALSRKADALNGWYGPARLFSFQQEVQPVFNKHCVSCHDYGKKAGEKLNLAGDRDVFFSTSYVDLWALKIVKCVGGGPAEFQEAYSWGSHVSPLIQVLKKGHNEVKLSKEEMDRLITWVDINAPYYPRYECAYPRNPGGRSPLTGNELKTLSDWTGVKVAGGHNARQRSQISFARPEKSRMLEKMEPSSENYKKAVDVIREGGKRLAEKPDADAPGFIPCEEDQARERRYQERLATESLIYEAIRTGKKIYDGDKQ